MPALISEDGMKRIAVALWTSAALFADVGISTSFRPQICGNDSDHVVVTWSGFDGSRFAVQQATWSSGGTWSAVSSLTGGGYDAFYSQPAINSSDNLFYIWAIHNGSFFQIQTGSGSFSTPLSRTYTLSNANSSSPQVKIDASGKGIAIWQEQTSDGEFVATASIYTDKWATPRDLSPPVMSLTTPAVAIEPTSGDAIAVWRALVQSDGIIQAAIHTGGGNWGSVANLSDLSVDAASPQVVMRSSGEKVVAWHGTVGAIRVIQTASYSDGSWQTPITLSPSEEGQLLNPHLSMNSSGHIVLVAEWRVGDASSLVAVERGSGTWGTFQKISGEDQAVSDASIVLNDTGQAIAIWKNGADSGAIRAAKLVGGTWTSPVTLSSASLNCVTPAVWMDSSGLAVATWQAANSTQLLFQVAHLNSFGGDWGAPITISD